MAERTRAFPGKALVLSFFYAIIKHNRRDAA